MRSLLSVFLLLGGLLVAENAGAGVRITFAQSGSDVVVTAAGTLTIPGSLSPDNNLYGRINPSQGSLRFAPPSGTNTLQNTFCLTPNTGFGSYSSNVNASASTGQIFGFYPNTGVVWLPTVFVSGVTNITSTVTFPNITVESLGINAGNTVYTCGTDTITVVGPQGPQGPQAVPSLSECAQLMLGLMVISILGWQWRKQHVIAE